MKQITLEEEARRAALIYDAMLIDRVLIKLMDGANKISVNDGQVEHGWPHALNVGGRLDLDGQEGLTWYISNRINQLMPGKISVYDQIKAGSAGLGHDSGRSIAVKNHNLHSAVLMNKYLIDLCKRQFGGADFLPNRFRARVVQLCAKHRADSWLYKDEAEKARRKKEIDGADAALLLLADKLCGSESRVPAEKLALLKQLAQVKVGKRFRKQWRLDAKWTPARISWGNPPEIAQSYSQDLIVRVIAILKERGIIIPRGIELDYHDQVNGSIEDRIIEIFADPCFEEAEASRSKYWGTMLYRMKVNEAIATRALVTELDWWQEAFHVSAKALKYLGLRFLIEFNGGMLAYDKCANNWMPVEARHA